MLKKIPFFLLVLVSSIGVSQEDYTLMFYNLLDFPEAPPANRDEILHELLEDVQPDIFMVCELQDATGADLILNSVLNDIGDTVYTMPTFVPNTSSISIATS